METTTTYLNEKNINWVAVCIKDKKPHFGNTFKNNYVKQLIEDKECFELIQTSLEKKLEEYNKLIDKNKDNEDFKKPNKPSYDIICADQNYMLSNDILIKKSQEIYIDEELYKKGFMIATDTSDIIQLDIDIDTDEDYNNKLTKNGKKLYQQLKATFPYYKSTSKKNGLHIFLIDKEDNKLTTKLKNCIMSKKVISDYDNFWKKDLEGKQINKDYGYIEIMCGKPLWCDEEIQNIKKKIGGAKSVDVLKTILKNDFVENNKKKTKQEIKNEVSRFIIEPPSPINNKKNDNIDNSNFQEICEYLNNIDKNNFDSYQTFLKIVWCLCKDSKDRYKQVLYDIGNNSSKSKENYDSWFDKLYRDGKIKSTYKSPYAIITLSKDSDLTKHYQIYNKYNNKSNIATFTPEELACIFYENNQDNIMVVKSEVAAEAPSVFYYNDIDFTWSNEEKNKYRIIKRNIYTDLTNYLQNKITYLEDLLLNCSEDDKDLNEKKINIVLEKLNKLGSTELRSQICECLIQKINTENQVVMKFDSNGYILPFKDCVYDLKQNTVRQFYKTDYILTKIPYEYREPTDDNYSQLTNFLTSLFPITLKFTKIDTSTPQGKLRNIVRRFIFNDYKCKKNKWFGFEVDKIHREDYWDLIYTLAMGLLGKTIPYIFIYNGEGCNGKSVICDLMKNILGNNKFYTSMKGNNLCEDMDVNAPSPVWANVDKKRFVAFQEPNENKELCVATLKYITESTIEARKLFSNETEVNVMAVYVLCCNVKPEVDGSSNNALERRIKDILFPYQFCNTPSEFKQGFRYEKKLIKNKKTDVVEEKIRNLTLKYMGIKNTVFAEESWQDEAKFSLLKYLLGFIKSFEKNYGEPIYKYDWKFSKIVEDRSKDYLSSGDRITEFLDNNLKIFDDSDKKYVKLGDIYKTFIERSEFYKTAKTSVKDKYSKNKFIHLISQNKKYFTHFRESKQIKGNDGVKKHIGKVLVNFEIKTEKEIISDSNDSKNECVISDSEEEEIVNDNESDSDSNKIYNNSDSESDSDSD